MIFALPQTSVPLSSQLEQRDYRKPKKKDSVYGQIVTPVQILPHLLS